MTGPTLRTVLFRNIQPHAQEWIDAEMMLRGRHFFVSLDGGPVEQIQGNIMNEAIGTAVATEGGLKKYLQDSIVLLASVRSGLADLLQQILDGDVGAFRELAEKQGELEKALKRVFEAEDRFNEWYARETDQGVPGDIDFDAVRHEIGCRLARIRECCGSD